MLATIRPGFTLQPNPDEVEHVFQVPLSFLMDPVNHEHGEWETRGTDPALLCDALSGLAHLGYYRRNHPIGL